MGRYWCTKPFMFSLEPRYEGLSGSQKYTAMHVRLLSSLCIAISRPWSNVMLLENRQSDAFIGLQLLVV